MMSFQSSLSVSEMDIFDSNQGTKIEASWEVTAVSYLIGIL
jgi:hypothetical protein